MILSFCVVLAEDNIHQTVLLNCSQRTGVFFVLTMAAGGPPLEDRFLRLALADNFKCPHYYRRCALLVSANKITFLLGTSQYIILLLLWVHLWSFLIFQTPCCDEIYHCRLCHDEKEEHTLNSKLVTKILCLVCNSVQQVQRYCGFCGERFGRVSIFNLITDTYA